MENEEGLINEQIEKWWNISRISESCICKIISLYLIDLCEIDFKVGRFIV